MNFFVCLKTRVRFYIKQDPMQTGHFLLMTCSVRDLCCGFAICHYKYCHFNLFTINCASLVIIYNKGGQLSMMPQAPRPERPIKQPIFNELILQCRGPCKTFLLWTQQVFQQPCPSVLTWTR